MILNFYAGNWDWDHHNWIAIRNRVTPGRGFKFFSWDAEHIVESLNANILSENNDKCPSRLFQQLRQNKDFLRLFADRVQKFCFNNGPLTPASAAERWTKRAGQIEKAVIAESARWGDYRRDVHSYHLHTAASVKITVLDLSGKPESILESENKLQGIYRTEWTGFDENGIKVPAGLYFYRIEAISAGGKSIITKKMLLIRN